MRTVTILENGWYFHRSDCGSALTLQYGAAVTLPHTWNDKDGQDGGNDYYRGRCWYVRKLERPALAPGEEVWLQIDGAAHTAEVFLGGKKLCTHEGGYSTFRCELTADLKDEENLLAIAVDNSENDRVYPQKADFTFYGGLYREVKLLTVPAAHFALGYEGTKGVKITPIVSGSTAEVTVQAWVEGPGRQVIVTIGDLTQTVPVENGTAAAVFTIENVHLWDGLNDPFLYTCRCELDSGDAVETRFGCRSFGFDPERGFILNGRPYPLRGVSRHQDRWGIGNALTEEEHREDLALIKEIGANTVRLAHYQHAQYFYDLCDEAGLIVWAEIPYITEHMDGGKENARAQMRELILQNYNHPSIVCWGLSNEISVHGVTEALIEDHRALNDLCHELDGTRPTAMAHAFMLEQDSPLLAIPDISSYNLYFGWYVGDLAQNDRFFDEYHAKYPHRIMGFSEYGADCNVQFQTARPEQGDYSEQYQCLYHEYILGCIARHPWLWATHCWNMFDFAADGRDEGGAHGINQKGLITMDRKLKKDAFYLYKAAWNKKDPFVRLCGSRYIDRPEEETEIRVYSNLPEVSLYRDGKLLETQQGRTVFVFRAELTGEHVFRAVAGSCEDTICVRRVERPNAAYTLNKTGTVANWFDEESFRSDCFSLRDSLGTLMAAPQCAAIVGPLMQKLSAGRGDVAKSASQNAALQKMISAMSFESLLKKAGDAVPAELFKSLNDRLQQIRK